mgnify:CR=1 FL=1
MFPGVDGGEHRRAAGMADHIAKPIDAVELKAKLARVLGAVTPVAPVLAGSITTGAVGTGTITNDDTSSLSISSPTVNEELEPMPERAGRSPS